MNKLLLALLLAAPVLGQAQTVGADAGARSDSGASAATGPITFEASAQRGSINTTPSVYVAPAVTSGITCMGSDSVTVGATGFGFGGSSSRESNFCNPREDAAVAFRMGYADVAAMRMFCFGADENRMAFEATGRRCPVTATARGSFDPRTSQVVSNYPNTGGQ